MSKLIAALDSINNMQLGENKHLEFKWSDTDMQEQIMQLYFQLVRADASQMEVLRTKFDSIVQSLFTLTFHGKVARKVDVKMYFTLIVRLVCQTRDIVSGKGEYALAYMMLHTLNNYFPDFAEYALEKFVMSDEGKKPYGSWKDMKYIASYCKTKLNYVNTNRLVKKCIQLINDQLVSDICKDNACDISLCAKWVPRESSKKHSWFFRILAKDFFIDNDFMKTAVSDSSKKNAKLKCYAKYRQMLAKLNNRIDTVQIKQCANTWASIDHNRTTSITLSRNKKAFLNVTKTGEVRSTLCDRITCAENFKTYIDSRIKSGKEVKGGNVGLNDFTRQAYELVGNELTNSIEIDLLNSQWRSNASQTGSLNKMIAMVDVSGSMEGDPMDVAIALGIRVAEKSILGKRVLTFSAEPEWHNLDKLDDFVSMVGSLKRAKWGANTNFYAALTLILKTMIEHKVPPEDADGLVLAIFSDMQIDSANNSSFNYSSMYKNINSMYEMAGYKCPHILFWNLRSTSGFPTLSNSKGTSMLSGFSPALLNLFCEKGMEALDQITPWFMMLESLNHERYSCLNEYIESHFEDMGFESLTIE